PEERERREIDRDGRPGILVTVRLPRRVVVVVVVRFPSAIGMHASSPPLQPPLPPVPGLFCSRLAAILEGGGFDLDVALEFLAERCVGEGHRLANALVRPVLPRGVDEDGVLAAIERPAMVVLAVPDDGVLAGGA